LSALLLGEAQKSVVPSFEVLNGTVCVLRERITPWHIGAVVLPTGDKVHRPSEWFTAVVFDTRRSQQPVCLRPHYMPANVQGRHIHRAVDDLLDLYP
jgi:hypothetical protein